jgi:hypothetical protein
MVRPSWVPWFILCIVAYVMYARRFLSLYKKDDFPSDDPKDLENNDKIKKTSLDQAFETDPLSSQSPPNETPFKNSSDNTDVIDKTFVNTSPNESQYIKESTDISDGIDKTHNSDNTVDKDSKDTKSSEINDINIPVNGKTGIKEEHKLKFEKNEELGYREESLWKTKETGDSKTGILKEEEIAKSNSSANSPIVNVPLDKDNPSNSSSAKEPSQNDSKGLNANITPQSQEEYLSIGCLSLAIITTTILVTLAYYIFTKRSDMWIKFILPDFIRIGQWTVLGLTVYLSLELRRSDKTIAGSILTLGFLILGMIVIIYVKDYYSAKLFILTLITIIALLMGSWKLKITLILAVLGFMSFGYAVVTHKLYTFFPFFTWLFIGEPELLASYSVILQQSALIFAGPFGQGADYITAVELVHPDKMGLNSIPYLAILCGYWGLAVYFVLLIAFMTILLINAFKLPSFYERAVALGSWSFLGINQYLSVFIVISPRALMIWNSPYGLPFIGSLESTFQLMLLANLIFRHHKES